MRKYWILPALVAAAGLCTLSAQPPEERRNAQPPTGPGGRGNAENQRGQPGRGDRGTRTDPAVEAWVKTLAEKITNEHDEIRDSARAGLVAIGPAAVPTLQAMMDGTGSAKSTAARRVIELIHQSQQMQATMLAQMGATSTQPGGQNPFGGGSFGTGGSGGSGGGMRGGNTNNPGGARPGGDQPRERPNANPPRGERPPGDGVNPMDAVLDDLELNDKQRVKVGQILDEHREKMREIREKATPERSREMHEAQNKAMMKEIKELLGEEKFAKFEEGMKKLRTDRRPEGDRPPRPEK